MITQEHTFLKELFTFRQQDLNFRALPHFGVHLDLAAVRFHDGFSDAHPEPGANRGFLRIRSPIVAIKQKRAAAASFIFVSFPILACFCIFFRSCSKEIFVRMAKWRANPVWPVRTNHRKRGNTRSHTSDFGELQKQVLELGIYKDGRKLQDHISAETYKKVTALLKAKCCI